MAEKIFSEGFTRLQNRAHGKAGVISHAYERVQVVGGVRGADAGVVWRRLEPGPVQRIPHSRAIRGERLQELGSCNDSEAAAELRQELRVGPDPLPPVPGEEAGKGEDRVQVEDEGTGKRLADEKHMVVPDDEEILLLNSSLLFPERNLWKNIMFLYPRGLICEI